MVTNILLRITIIKALVLFGFNGLYAQAYINFSVDGNYWEHTDLYGVQAGVGLDYRINRLGFRVGISHGFGDYDRLQHYKDLRFDNTKVLVNHINGRGGHFDPSTKSDYARQYQFDAAVFFKVIKFSDRIGLNLQLGGFYSIIEHYYIFDYVLVPKLEHFQVFELDMLMISDQRFYTMGGRGEINLEIQRGNSIYSPYFAIGLGPNYTNFTTIGLRYCGGIRKKG